MRYTIRGIYKAFSFETDLQVSFHSFSNDKHYLSIQDYPDGALHPETRRVYVDLMIKSNHGGVVSSDNSIAICGFDDEILENIKEEFIRSSATALI